MSVSWTKDQEKVIALRDRSILVSAAAGSGKTAVLVQRILSKITDPEKPVDIDRMLIMTFTRAAAGEMKERIADALRKALLEDPDNVHLQRQMTLIHTAQINTIHGFCSYVVNNYFHRIDLDPSYRIADEGEICIMKKDVADEVLADWYAREDEKEFERLVECVATGRDDAPLAELVLSLYEAASGDPDPQGWLDSCGLGYHFEEGEGLGDKEWGRLLFAEIRESLAEAVSLLNMALDLSRDDGPSQYVPLLEEELSMTEALLELSGQNGTDWKAGSGDDLRRADMAGQAGSPDALQRSHMAGVYDRLREAFSGVTFRRLPGKTTASDGGKVDPAKKEMAKKYRDEAKAVLTELSDSLSASGEEEILAFSHTMEGPLKALIALTKDFMDRFSDRKREKGILDFSDLEHMALDILRVKTDEGYEKTEAARELSERFDEVMVDEYQDSNLVQEQITNCVSGWAKERKNVFMVGDVKQSIYRFRRARPELFMEKYKAFTLEDSKEQRVDLHMNFRSRHEVLDSVNYLCRQLMGEDLGGVSYDEAAALHCGASYSEGRKEDSCTELLLFPTEDEALPRELSGKDKKELEALMIAQRIRRIVDQGQVLDGGAYRRARYGDIVILLRTFAGWGETFSEVLSSQGIPVYALSRTGYFSATEVVLVLNYLRICQNPRQDIPLEGVLRSPMGGFSDHEIGLIRSCFPEGSLFDSLAAAAGRNVPEELSARVCAFLSLLDEIRDLTPYTPVHQLISEILKRTGYGSVVRALPNGEQRQANLSMLEEKAMEYEKTSYRGLFHFLRYIEDLYAYQVDYGEANLTGAGENVVRIMTIHRSKGLEFPIVFVAGMTKMFNFQDVNAGFLIHPELGVGIDYLDPDRRLKIPALQKRVIQKKLKEETLGEELRVLYVAMTRAREKLILTGTLGDIGKELLRLVRYIDRKEELLPIRCRKQARSAMDFVLPALSGHRCLRELFLSQGILNRGQPFLEEDSSDFLVRILSPEEMVFAEAGRQAEMEEDKEMVLGWDPGTIINEEIHSSLRERFTYQYPHEKLQRIPVKVSVSELKKRSLHEDSEAEECLIKDAEVYPILPRFILEERGMADSKGEKTEELLTGADRGTAYHKVMECLDYRDTASDEALLAQIRKLVEQRKLSGRQAACIDLADIRHFLETPLGKRMEKAGKAGLLMREQPFMMAQPASSLLSEWDTEASVLVQGIIDACFLEGEDIVLVDYKTDRVGPEEEQRLIERYRVQLWDYALALRRMTGRKVKESYIYSFTLGKSLEI